jgi:uncharacterized protein YdcH (DUF465 family)
MHVDHHDVYTEFPDMRDAIDALKAEGGYIGSLFGRYNRLTGKVEDLEEHDMPVADFTLEDMKKARVKLKDEILPPAAGLPRRPETQSLTFLPHGRLAVWYFWYFAFIGAFLPYFALYLQSIGLSAGRIAVLMSLGQLMRLLAPLLWSWLADSGGRRVRLVIGSTAARWRAFRWCS